MQNEEDIQTALADGHPADVFITSKVSPYEVKQKPQISERSINGVGFCHNRLYHDGMCPRLSRRGGYCVYLWMHCLQQGTQKANQACLSILERLKADSLVRYCPCFIHTTNTYTQSTVCELTSAPNIHWIDVIHV